MNYVDEGPRLEEALVFVHGNPTWSFYFRRLIGKLSGRFRCIAPDHIGMGLSDKPEDYPYTLATRIRDLGRLIESLGLKRVHLIVHDWGGAIGSGWAVKNPERVGRIVYLNTGAFLSDRIPARINLCRTRFPGTFLIRGLNGFAGPATWMSVKKKPLSGEEKRGFLYPYGSWAERVAVNAFVKDIPMEPEHPSRGTLADIEAKLPVLAEKKILLFWGGRDFCFDRSFFDRFVGFFPLAEQRYLEQAGHYVLEDAGEQDISYLCNWISGTNEY